MASSFLPSVFELVEIGELPNQPKEFAFPMRKFGETKTALSSLAGLLDGLGFTMTSVEIEHFVSIVSKR